MMGRLGKPFASASVSLSFAMAAMHHQPKRAPEKLVIIGSGPAGHAAAVYAARAQLNPLMYEGFMAGGVAAGGQLTTTTDVENYPGFPQGITGIEITSLFREQSARFGTRINTETVEKVDLSSRPFKIWPEGLGENEAPVLADSIIIATGATAKRLGIPGEETYWQSGISACAVCDGAVPIFRNKPLAVVGGGDSACEEATFLTKYASHVYLVVRRDQLRASKIMQERVFNNKNITILWNSKPVEAVGDGKFLSGLKLQDTASEEDRQSMLDVRGLFYAIGHKPNTDFLKDSGIELEQDGYIRTRANGGAPSTYTNIPGVFACGDVQDKIYRQAVTAAGSGCMAALDCERWLEGANT